MAPRKGLCYNYESLLEIAESLYPDTMSRGERVEKLLTAMSHSANSIAVIPKDENGKHLYEDIKSACFPIETHTSFEEAIPLADKIYAACIAKDN